MRRVGSWGKDAGAVSSVVGTVLMLTITIALFSGFAVVVLSQVGQDDAPVRVDVRVLAGQEVLLQHRGGEALLLADGFLIVHVAGAPQQLPLTTFSNQLAQESFRIGDTLCISCQFPGGEVEGVALVYRNTLLLSHGDAGGSA